MHVVHRYGKKDPSAALRMTKQKEGEVQNPFPHGEGLGGAPLRVDFVSGDARRSVDSRFPVFGFLTLTAKPRMTKISHWRSK